MGIVREIATQTSDITATTSDSISELAELAAQLRHSVSHFRLPAGAAHPVLDAGHDDIDEIVDADSAEAFDDESSLDLDLAEAGQSVVDVELDAELAESEEEPDIDEDELVAMDDLDADDLESDDLDADSARDGDDGYAGQQTA